MIKNKSSLILSMFSLLILFFLMTSIGLRFFTRQIIVKGMGITNTLTDIILFDVDALNSNSNTPKIDIDWHKLYPCGHEEAISNETDSPPHTPINLIKSKITSIQNNIESYASDFLVAHNAFTYLAQVYEKSIHWNYAPYSEYNSVIKMHDGYLTSLTSPFNTDQHLDAIVSFAQFCNTQDVPFWYIQAPTKISKYEDLDLSGSVDFSNQNADSILSGLDRYGISYLDLRECIVSDGLRHHELFYRTDHHWKAETGLWAAQHSLQLLSDHLEYDVDPTILNAESFSSSNYPSWFLGSEGKKTTLAQTTPDDFSLLYPNYETRFSYKVPSINIDTVGDFSIMYDLTQLNEKDYYNKSPYDAYFYGNKPFEQVHNQLLDNNKHLLVIHDSFGNSMLPFLSLGVEYVDSIDPRHFTGCLETFVSATRPDAILLMYYPGTLDNPDAFIFH